MFRILFILLFSFAYIGAHAQSVQSTGNATDTAAIRGSFKVGVKLRMPSLPNTHALGVLTTDEKGIVKLDTLDAATGVSIEILTDTSDAIHSWVWSIVSNPTIDSYLYATRAWHKKGMDSIAVWAGSTFVSTETDPVFLTYPAAGIGNADISNWNTAYNNRVTSVATGYGVSGGTITVTGTISSDTAAMATRNRVQKAVDSLNVSIGTKGSGTVTNVATNSGTGITGGAITGTGTIAADTFLLNTRLWREKLKDSLNILIAAKGAGTVTSVGTGYGVSGGAITSSGTIVADTATLFQKYTTTLAAGSGVSISGRTISATGGSGTVTNVIGGTNISITGTSTVQPTVNITGTIAVANGGTGTTATTSVNATPITYGSNNTITVPIATGVTGLGTGVATWAATPSSANLASALTDETGSGAAVFATKPTFVGTIHTPSAVAASAFDGSAGNYFTRTLTSSQTFTQSNFSTGQNFIVVLTQGSGTTYNPTWWSGITWVTSGGTAPTMTTTTNGITTYGFTCTGTNTFLGYLVGTQ